MSTFAIETNGLSKHFGDVRAVDAIDLRVGAGEIYGFLGLNGAGKTNTIRALLGMIRPSAGNVEFWQREIRRWANTGIVIVLENDTDKLPVLLVQLVNKVDNPTLGLCTDIGYQHMFSELNPLEWVRRMNNRLRHIHLHDNDRTGDNHWSIGRGTIDFEPFYAALLEHVPQATLSLEVEDSMEVKMGDLRRLATYFAPK